MVLQLFVSEAQRHFIMMGLWFRGFWKTVSKSGGRPGCRALDVSSKSFVGFWVCLVLSFGSGVETEHCSSVHFHSSVFVYFPPDISF